MTAQKTEMQTMFGTAQTGDGESGPFLGYSPKGSVDKGLGRRSWFVRAKDGDGWTFTPTDAMDRGVMFDLWAVDGKPLGSLKLGWVKDTGGVRGVAPERRWNPDVTMATARPSEEKGPTGKFLWSPTFAIRVATIGGDVLTFEGGSFAVYDAMNRVLQGDIAAQITASPGLCPIVKVTGYADQVFKGGSTSIPTLGVVAWKPRHPALISEAPTFAAPPAQPAPPPAPKPQPATAGAGDFGAEW